MKLSIEQSLNNKEVEITIKCNIIDPALEKLINQIRLYGFSIVGKKNDKSYIIKLEDIFYFESIDDKTFIYSEKEVYDYDTRLYELEEQLDNTPFVRISKKVILNTAKIMYVKPQLNGRFEVKLENNESVIVTRHYLPLFKRKFNV